VSLGAGHPLEIIIQYNISGMTRNTIRDTDLFSTIVFLQWQGCGHHLKVLNHSKSLAMPLTSDKSQGKLNKLALESSYQSMSQFNSRKTDLTLILLKLSQTFPKTLLNPLFLKIHERICVQVD
jgi:hypothetical protein